MGKAQESAEAFHTWHSSRTFNPGNAQIDPWLRDVLVSLQATLYTMAKQIDDNSSRLDKIEAFLRRQ